MTALRSRLTSLLLPAIVFSLSIGLWGTRLAAADDAPRVVLETSLGSITLELDDQRAPLSVENFLAYLDSGFYDGTIFHRVIEGFMIQGGGFTPDFGRKATRAPIRNEAANGLSNRPYTIAMARTNEPHSATAQFFINTVDNRNLDHTEASPRGWGYAVFGKVIDGFETVDAIAEVATGPGGPFSRDAPAVTVSITSVHRLLDNPAEPGQDPGPAESGSTAPIGGVEQKPGVPAAATDDTQANAAETN